MKHYIRIGFMAIVMLLALASVAFCADYNNWGNTDTYQLLGREMTYDQVYMGQARGGVSLVTTGTTTLAASFSFCEMYATTKTVTLGNGVPGQVITLAASRSTLYTLGTCAITPTTATGFTTVTLDARGETVTLQYVDDTYGWVIVGVLGATAA